MQNYNTIIGVISMREKGFSTRDCRARFSLGSSTVTLIMKRYKELGLSLTDLRTMDPDKVEKIFFPPESSRCSEIPLPDYAAVYQRKNAKGSKANLFFLWKQYKKEHPDGYQYTQFVEHYNRYVKENYGVAGVSMAVNRVPGERMYIDWVGDQPELIVNRETGELSKVHVFVTTVGVSSKIYAELFPNEKQSNFVRGTVNAINYYGAVARYFVPDNAKTAVTKHTKDELLINAVYQDLESFYDVVILPPPARKPKGYLQFQIIFKNQRNRLYHRISPI